MDIEEVKTRYDGYSFPSEPSVYSPRSVVNSMLFGKIENYWNQTETFEALQAYIDMNFEGLKDDVLSVIAGECVPVNTGSFTNDMTTFRTEDDVLTLLIHLGYLAYDSARNFYTVHRELAGGKGFADLVFIPRKKFQEKSALVVELKWDKMVEGAINQIKKKEYCQILEEYKGNILLVGVNYNKKTKVHECMIEEYKK